MYILCVRQKGWSFSVAQTQLVVWVTVKGDTLNMYFHPSLPHREVFDIHAPLDDLPGNGS